MEGSDIVYYTVMSVKGENDNTGKGILKCVEDSLLDWVARV